MSSDVYTHTHAFLCPTCFYTHTHTHTFSLPLSPSLSLSHTHTHSPTQGIVCYSQTSLQLLCWAKYNSRSFVPFQYKTRLQLTRTHSSTYTQSYATQLHTRYTARHALLPKYTDEAMLLCTNAPEHYTAPVPLVSHTHTHASYETQHKEGRRVCVCE